MINLFVKDTHFLNITIILMYVLPHSSASKYPHIQSPVRQHNCWRSNKSDLPPQFVWQIVTFYMGKKWNKTFKVWQC